jgi:hypothetical protein
MRSSRALVRVLAAAALLAALPGRLCAEDEPAPEAAPPAAAEEAGAFAARVDAAIEKGVGWLKSRQMQEGTWRFVRDDPPVPVGDHALVLLTLAKCGVGAKDPVMARGIKALDRLFPFHVGTSKWGSAKTYDVAVTVMFYEALASHEAPGAPKLTGTAARRVREVADWLARTQEKNVWRYPSSDHSEDLSATQYALLALEMASRCGVTVEPGVYHKALDYLLANQEAQGPASRLIVANEAWAPGARYARWLKANPVNDRGWPYRTKEKVTGSMTAAGVACLAIVKGQLRQAKALDPENERAIDAAMLDGLAWLGSKFTAQENPGDGKEWHYYYLYGVERVGAFLGVPNLGEHDWYREGAEHLLAAQTADGSWPGSGTGSNHPRIQTCFALLFLKRATTPPSVPVTPAVTTDGE